MRQVQSEIASYEFDGSHERSTISSEVQTGGARESQITGAR